jgi:hypothetical protein
MFQFFFVANVVVIGKVNFRKILKFRNRTVLSKTPLSVNDKTQNEQRGFSFFLYFTTVLEHRRERGIIIHRYYQFEDYFYVTDGNIMYLTDASRFLISCVIQHYAPVVGWGGGGWGNRCIMLIMTLDPSWRQTLRLPPPGIKPGSPAPQHINLLAVGRK